MFWTLFGFVVLLILFFYLMIYGINLAWRNPEKLKKKAIENSTKFYGSDAFIWMARFMTVIYGLMVLILIFLFILVIIGFLRII